ncbi:MAG TPA: helix-turn-helix transcriptional regulator [Acidimicrobiales bacterium]|nr:helix-turn-helix transcriptional regulator [Acidimicrobiales bacterium]
MTALATAGSDFGTMLRTWRATRRMSQLELASAAGVSSRHLSFIETGRSRPSREMVVHLAEQLDVPLRERNALLNAAGFAALYRETALTAPEMEQARAAIDLVLERHPFPAIAVDRRWDLVSANDRAFALVDGVDPALLGPPLNVYRVSVHPDGLRPRIENFDEYADHLLSRLQHQVAVSADPELVELLEEIRDLVGRRHPNTHLSPSQVLLPLRIRTGDRVLSFMSTIAVFGTPVDITLAELAIETFFPADSETAALLS